MNKPPIDIFCDESGYTGMRLLDPEQRVFSFAAVAVGDEEAWHILDAARRRHGVLGGELKAATLLKTEQGRALVLESLRAIESRYRFVIFDKLLGLCTKLFEYIYEPVFKDDPRLLYQKDLHRFVGMYCYMFFSSGDPVAERALREFESFMRTLDPNLAPSLFDPAQQLEPDNPFEMVRRFAQGYRDLILHDNLDGLPAMADGGKWTLDLGIASLWSLLSHFGAESHPLRVICDRSQPLEAAVASIGEDDISSISAYAENRFGKAAKLGWVPARPIGFGDSRDHPGLQLADLVASAATASLHGDIERRGLAPIVDALNEHIHPHSVMPDFDQLDLTSRKAAVNWMILFGLGERAQRGEDPYALLPELYLEGERSFDRGEFKAMVLED
jgi:hypothetical protein